MDIQLISFRCVVKDRMGKVIGTTYSRDVFAQDGISKDLHFDLNSVVSTLKPGDKKQIELSADEAYGYYDTKKVMEIDRTQLPAERNPRLGEKIVQYLDDGKEAFFHVTKITGDRITLDGNHPLAGQDLIFEIEATNTRMSSAEELKQTKIVSPINRSRIH